MDIITSNIKISSQNLNQPDLFYAGLLNNLITKKYPNFKEPHLLSNKNINSNNNINIDIKNMVNETIPEESNISPKNGNN